MANYTQLKAAINRNINTNGVQAITGDILNSILNDIVDEVGAHATYVGMAIPTTDPDSPVGNVFYVTSTAGVYENFGGLEVADGEIAILTNNTYTGSWRKDVIWTVDVTQVPDLSMMDVSGEPLTARTTANCYVVREAGQYQLPLVYGNGIKNGEVNSAAYTNIGGENMSDFVNHLDVQITSPYIEENANCAAADCEIVWQDEENMISDIELVEGNGVRFLRFVVNTVPELNGNAVVAVKDANGDIMWSWHIWATTDDLTALTFTNHTGVNYDLMPINLGTKWYANEHKTGTSLFYQWGRKDPLPILVASNNSLSLIYGTQYEKGVYVNTIGDSIKRPYAQIHSNSNWSVRKYNIWNAALNVSGASDDQATAVKTIYDPCPVGFMLPSGRAFTGFTTTGATTTEASEMNIIGSLSTVPLFMRNANDTVGNRFIFRGYVSFSGSIEAVSSNGYYSTYALNASQLSYYMYSSTTTEVRPSTSSDSSSSRSEGRFIRPCREQ